MHRQPAGGDGHLRSLAYALAGKAAGGTTIRFPDGQVIEMGLVEGLRWLASLSPEDYELVPGEDRDADEEASDG